jgi:hypothetical protein
MLFTTLRLVPVQWATLGTTDHAMSAFSISFDY